MFNKVSSHLSDHPFQRHIFFLGLAILASVINGYHYGTFDQVFHITFLKKFIDPNLYPNDPFLNLRWYHFSYFWFPFIPIFKAGILKITMFVIHILTVYGTIWMFWSLSQLLFENARANLLLSIALIFPHIGLPGFQIIEFSLLNRTFVLPFILGSIWLYLKGKRLLAFFLLGLMFNLHVIYAIFVLCMFLLHELITFDWHRWHKPVIQTLIFLLAGLPVLIWRIQTGSGIDLTFRPGMLDLASRGLLYTVYYPIGPISHVIGNFLAGIGTLWAFFLGYQQSAKSHTQQMMRNFVIAIGVLLMIAIITSYILPITILLQIQILRAGVFLLYFSMLYLSHFICVERQNGHLSKGDFILLGLSFIILITPLITILLWFIAKKLKTNNKNTAWLIPVVFAIQFLTIFAAIQSGLWAPGFHIDGPDSYWREIQEWAQQNTSIDAMFITPPHLFGHYTPDWRVFSERSTLATIPEMMEIPFNPDFSISFQHRFNAIAPDALESFNGNFLHTLEITKDAFYENSADDFTTLACQFSVDYLVVEQGHLFDFEIIQQNPGFILYKLPSCP